jgi:hypothetical protein
VFGEGNCYYRAVFFGVCEHHLMRGNYDCLQDICKQFQGVTTAVNKRHQSAHIAMIAVVQRLSKRLSPYSDVEGTLSGADAVAALAKFTTEHDWFDAAVVRGCKQRLVQDIIHKHRNSITHNGAIMAALCDLELYGTVEKVCTTSQPCIFRRGHTLDCTITKVVQHRFAL